MQNEEASGVILHIAPFTDSKKLLSIFTREHGKLKVVWRGSKKQTLAKIFTPCTFEWRGKSGLKTLVQMDELSAPILTSGRSLYCGMYLNEICVRLLPEYVGVSNLYEIYIETLNKLAQSSNQNTIMEILLRRFEFSLLSSLGLGINFNTCASGEVIQDNSALQFRFICDEGFRLESSNITKASTHVFTGADIVAIRNQQWNDAALKAAKRLSRLALAPLLGEKPIKSRELFT